MYDPTVGRWLSQDPIGFKAGDPNLYRYVGNGPTNATDPSGLKIKGVGDLLPHFKKYLDKDLNILIDKKKDPRGYTRAMILKGMFECEDTFVLKGDTIKENVKNLVEHVEARREILKRTLEKKFRFGAGKNFKKHHTVSPEPDFDSNPREYYDSINNDKTAIACLHATELVMACGVGQTKQLLDRNATDENDFVPGDWGYIYNDSHQYWNGDRGDTPWDHGLEGENIIYVGDMGFWGHFGPGNTYFPFDQWMRDVGNFPSKNGDPAKPRRSDRVQCPNIGIDHIEEN
jgi:uncharacterized protein RhaS with RHS repeats